MTSASIVVQSTGARPLVVVPTILPCRDIFLTLERDLYEGTEERIIAIAHAIIPLFAPRRCALRGSQSS
jgi:hypothetical protein